MIALNRSPCRHGFCVTSKVHRSMTRWATPYCAAARTMPGTSSLAYSQRYERFSTKRLTFSAHLPAIYIRTKDQCAEVSDGLYAGTLGQRCNERRHAYIEHASCAGLSQA
jgi:hypothetical protein